MATAEQYAQWIVANKDKQGTPEFEVVKKAYLLSRQGGITAPTPTPVPTEKAGFWGSFKESAATLGLADEAAAFAANPTAENRKKLLDAGASKYESSGGFGMDQGLSGNWEAFKETLGGSLGFLVAPVAAATAGSALTPVAGVAAGASTLASQYATQNLLRQAQEQERALTEGRAPEETSISKALTGAAGSTALDYAGMKFFGPLFNRFPVLKNLLGEADEAAARETGNALEEALKSGKYEITADGLFKGAGKGMAFEIPQEIAQQAIERWQAGLSLVDEDARSEYAQAAIGAGLLGGPMGAASVALDQRAEKQKKLDEEAQYRADRSTARVENAERDISEIVDPQMALPGFEVGPMSSLVPKGKPQPKNDSLMPPDSELQTREKKLQESLVTQDPKQNIFSDKIELRNLLREDEAGRQKLDPKVRAGIERQLSQGDRKPKGENKLLGPQREMFDDKGDVRRPLSPRDAALFPDKVPSKVSEWDDRIWRSLGIGPSALIRKKEHLQKLDLSKPEDARVMVDEFETLLNNKNVSSVAVQRIPELLKLITPQQAVEPATPTTKQKDFFPPVPAGPVDRYEPAPLGKAAAVADLPSASVIQPRQEADAARARVDIGDMFPEQLNAYQSPVQTAERLGVKKNSGLFKRLQSTPKDVTMESPAVRKDFEAYAKKVKGSDPAVSAAITKYLNSVTESINTRAIEGGDYTSIWEEYSSYSNVILTPKLMDKLGVSEKSMVRNGKTDLTGKDLRDPEVQEKFFKATDVRRDAKMKATGLLQGAPSKQLDLADAGIFDKNRPAPKKQKPVQQVVPTQEIVEPTPEQPVVQEKVQQEPAAPVDSAPIIEEALAERDADIAVEKLTPDSLWEDFGPEGVKWGDLTDDQQDLWSKWVDNHPPTIDAALQVVGLDTKEYLEARDADVTAAQNKQRTQDLIDRARRGEELTEEDARTLNLEKLTLETERKQNERAAIKASEVISRKFNPGAYVVDLDPTLEEGVVGPEGINADKISDRMMALVWDVTQTERTVDATSPDLLRKFAAAAESELNQLETSTRVIKDKAAGLPVTHDLAMNAYIMHRLGALINAYRVIRNEQNRPALRKSGRDTKATKIAKGVIDHGRGNPNDTTAVTPALRDLAQKLVALEPTNVERKIRGRRATPRYINLDTLGKPQVLDVNTITLNETDLKASGVEYYSKTRPVGEKLSDTAANNIKRGDLRTAIADVMGGTANQAAKQVLGKIQRMGLKTKIVTRKMSEYGAYDPVTDTITLDPDAGMNEHTFVHELVHAAISHVLRNPDAKLTKDMLKFFEQIKDRMGSAYGGTSLQEFASELISNPEFQALLKTIKAPKSDNLFQRIMQNIAEFFGFRKGGTAYSKGLQYVSDALDISKKVKADPADVLFFGGRDNLSDVVTSAAKKMPVLAGNKVEDTRNFMSNLPYEAKIAGFGLMRLDNINTLYGKVLTGIKDLMDALELRLGREERNIKKVNDNYLKFTKVQEKHPEAMKRVNKLANNTRREGLEVYTWVDYVDPKTDTPVSKAFVDAVDADSFAQTELKPHGIEYRVEKFTPTDKQKAQYGRYRAELQNLPAEVQDVYKTIRASYRQALNEYEHFLLQSVSPSLAAEMKVEFQTRRRVPGYIPFMRWGTKWLEFMDPQTGEMVKKAFESERERGQFIDREMRPRRLDYRKFERMEETRFDPGTIPPTQFIAKVMRDLSEQGVSESGRNSVYQAYLELFPGQSIAKQFMHAENTPGMEEDIVRGYGDTMIKWVRKIGNSEFTPKIDHALTKIEEEAKQHNDPTVSAAAQNILKQAKFFHNPTFNSAVHMATAFSYFEYIAGSISSAVVNLSTLPMFTYPILGGKFGYKNATKAMTEASKIMVNGLESSPKYKKLYDTLMDHAQLEHTMAREVLEGRRTSTDQFNGAWATTMRLISTPFSMAERANRGVTAVAAYELAKQSGMTDDKAIAYALQTTKDINTSGMAASSPRWMQSGIGRVALTFKSFPWNSAFIVAKTFVDATRKLPPDQKHIAREARRQLLGIYGMGMAFAGTAGLPFMGALATFSDLIAALFGDDDEPFDFKTEMRLFVGDLAYKGGINAMTNLEISSRVSIANDLLFRDDPKSVADHGYALTAMQQAFGPLGSYVVGVEKGVEAFNQGHVDRAIESLLPKALRDISKAVRFNTDGATTLKGEPIVNDVSTYNEIMQAIGFGPADLSLAYESISMRSQFETKLEARRQKLVRRMDAALTAGDEAMAKETVAMINKFNQAHPRFAITMQTIKKSRQGRQAARQALLNGVSHNRQLLPEIKEKLGFEE